MRSNDMDTTISVRQATGDGGEYRYMHACVFADLLCMLTVLPILTHMTSSVWFL
jgi:hypothetical protein